MKERLNEAKAKQEISFMNLIVPNVSQLLEGNLQKLNKLEILYEVHRMLMSNPLQRNLCLLIEQSLWKGELQALIPIVK